MSWAEDCRNARCLEFGAVLFGDHAADEDERVLHCSVLLEAVHDLWNERVVSARENRDSEDIDVFLDGSLDDLFGCFVQSGVDDFEPGVTKGACNNVCSAVVTVEPDFRNHTPNTLLIAASTHRSVFHVLPYHTIGMPDETQ